MSGTSTNQVCGLAPPLSSERKAEEAATADQLLRAARGRVRGHSRTLAQLTVLSSEPATTLAPMKESAPMAAGRVPLEVHLDPLGAEERAIWDRYVKLVDASGPAEM